MPGNNVKILYDFLISKKIRPEQDKVMVNTKLIYILNDQMQRFISRSKQNNFLEFLYSNAMEKNQNDLSKITDFFSRILTTIINLSGNVYEVKSLAFALNEQIRQREVISKYLDIRLTLLLFKGEDASLKNLTSHLTIRESELFSISKYFGINVNDFKTFLERENLPPSQNFLSLDVVIYYILEQSSKIPFDFSAKNEKAIKKLINRNALRRVLLRVRFVCRLMIRIRHNKQANNLVEYEKVYDSMRILLKEKTYFKQNLSDALKKTFIENYQSKEIARLPSIIDEFDKLVNDEKENFYVLLSKKVINSKNSVELSKHLFQLFHLKQMTDIKKFGRELEESKNREADIAKLNTISKDFYLFEFFKRESLEGLRKQLGDNWEDIVKEKFVKEEVFDKEVIIFIKKLETNLVEHLSLAVKQREKEIIDLVEKIKPYPIMDEFVSIFRKNIDQIKAGASIHSIIHRENKDIIHSMDLTQKSRILNRTQLGKSALDQKGLILCAKCRGILDESPSNNIPDKLTVKAREDEDIIDNEQQINKSILDYVNKKKMNMSKINIDEAKRNSLAHRRQLIKQTDDSNENGKETKSIGAANKDLVGQGIIEKNVKAEGVLKNLDGVQNPPCDMMNDDNIPPPPILNLPKFFKQNQALSKNNTINSKNIPIAPIIDKNGDLTDIPPAPILNLPFRAKIPQTNTSKNDSEDNNFIPPAPMINFGKNKKNSPPPVFKIAEDDVSIPPAPIINLRTLSTNKDKSHQNDEADIPPAPMIKFGFKTSPVKKVLLENTSSGFKAVPKITPDSTDIEIPPPPTIQIKNLNPPSAPAINLKLPMTHPPKNIGSFPLKKEAEDEGLIPPPPTMINFKNKSPGPSPFTTFNNLDAPPAPTIVIKERQQLPLQQLNIPSDIKLKPLFWEKIENNQLSATIWMHIQTQPVSIKIEKIVEYFQDIKIEKKVQIELQARTQKIDLIGDETRKNILSIALTKLFKINKLTWEETMQMILEINENKIGIESFLSLKKLGLSTVELEIARNYKDNIDTLDLPSRWLCEVMVIPRYEQRFDSLSLINEFNKDYMNYREFLDNFFAACEMFQDNRSFQKFLRVSIDAGNIINDGNRRGNAYGFKVISLIEFFSCKSSVKLGLSLMEYILFEIYAQSPSTISFVEAAVQKLKVAITRNIEDVVDETMELKRKFGVLRSHLEAAERSIPVDSFFILKFEGFMANNGEKIVILEEELKKTKEFYFETMLFLGEQERRLKDKKSKEVLTVFYNTFNQMQGCIEKFKK
jgi:hypothetical protein